MSLINFDGGKDKTRARAEMGVLGGDGSFKTRFYDTADGTAELRTKNGMPQVRVTETISNAVTPLVGKVLDFLSGFVVGGYNVAGIVSEYFPTAESAGKFGMSPSTGYAMSRLSVPLAQRVGAASLNGSQYRDVRASFYSGSMRALAQFVLGIGVTKYPSWYALHKTLPDFVSSAYVDKTSVPLQYEYSFDSTHGVVFGADGEPWLAHISKAYGVWVFPLSREPGTCSAEFREAIVGDAEGTLVWNTFKGFPTGEAPSSSEYDHWKNAGCGFQILRPDQMQRYVDSTSISYQLGWAFNYDGSEARVVGKKNIVGAGIDYYENSYLQVQITIPAMTPRNTSATARACAIQVAAPLVSLPWLRTKLEYLSDAQCTALMAQSASSVVTWLEAATIEPIAAPSASFNVLEAVPLNVIAGQVKVWNPSLEICASLALESKGLATRSTDCAISVHYDTNGVVELRWADGSGTLTAGPYVARYNTRAIFATSDVQYTAWTTQVTIPKTIFLHMFWDNTMDHYVKYWWREHRRTKKTRSSSDGNGSVFIPYGDREALVFAALKSHAGGTDSTEFYTDDIQDSRGYFPANAYVNGTTEDGSKTVTYSGCSVPYLNRVFVSNTNGGDGRSDMGWPISNGAGELTWPNNSNMYDGGSWATPCQEVATGSWDAPAYPSAPDLSVAPLATFEVVLLSNNLTTLIISDSGAPADIHYKYDIWFKPSSLQNDPQTVRTATNCLGQTTTFQCYDDINSGSYKVFGDVVNPIVLGSNPCYLGVV